LGMSDDGRQFLQSNARLQAVSYRLAMALHVHALFASVRRTVVDAKHPRRWSDEGMGCQPELTIGRIGAVVFVKGNCLDFGEFRRQDLPHRHARCYLVVKTTLCRVESS